MLHAGFLKQFYCNNHWPKRFLPVKYWLTLQIGKQNSYRKTWSHVQWTLQHEEMLSIGKHMFLRFHLLVFGGPNFQIRDEILWDVTRAPELSTTKVGRAMTTRWFGSEKWLSMILHDFCFQIESQTKAMKRGRPPTPAWHQPRSMEPRGWL